MTHDHLPKHHKKEEDSFHPKRKNETHDHHPEHPQKEEEEEEERDEEEKMM